jgi:hypothetical protein
MCLEASFEEEYVATGREIERQQIIDQAVNAARRVISSECDGSSEELNYVMAQAARKLLGEVFDHISARLVRLESEQRTNHERSTSIGGRSTADESPRQAGVSRPDRVGHIFSQRRIGKPASSVSSRKGGPL